MRLLLVTEAVEFGEKFKKICTEEHGLRTFLTLDSLVQSKTPFDFECAICDERFFSGLREKFSGPIFILSSTSSTKNWISGLKQGADGVLFQDQPAEGALLQIFAFQRRWMQRTAARRFLPRIGLMIDLDKYRVELDGKPLNLTLTELKVLKELANEDDHVVPRATIQQEVFGQLAPGNRSLDVHVCSLRKKLRPHGLDVESVRGVGYRLLLQSSSGVVRMRSVVSEKL